MQARPALFEWREEPKMRDYYSSLYNLHTHSKHISVNSVDIHFQNTLLLPLSLLLCSMLLPNCEGSHSVRLSHMMVCTT